MNRRTLKRAFAGIFILAVIILSVVPSAFSHTVSFAQSAARSGLTIKEVSTAGVNMFTYRRQIPSSWIVLPTKARYELRLTVATKVVQRCPYTGSRGVYTLIRRQYTLTAQVRDLTTNRQVATRTFLGGTPTACARTELFSPGFPVRYRNGSLPNAATFGTWVKTTMARYGLK